MMPALGVVAIGKGKWPALPIPLPLFLLWPLVAVALGAVILAQRLVSEPSDARSGLLMARTALLAFCQLSGLCVDLRSADGDRVRVWLW
jgi:hypothetical protein